ncbi:hypothetical protein DFJ63DRAFT_24732 [Scheffersomyces coipomensis]|uniref:uncharacterized protein n=1 Tax=Scheffersomyces coipomensis TaxID=1788519 RepID=UPI00315CB44E
MSGRSTMPGSYPIQATSTNSSSRSYVNPIASNILDQELATSFEGKHTINLKNKHQQHIVIQLETLVYILVGYQFIKYCHSACIMPIILHISVQRILGCEVITSNTASGRLSGIPGILILRNDDDIEPTLREQIKQLVLTKACFTIYWKTIFTIFYHTIFITSWVMSINNHGHLKSLEHGTWWVISFIGEETPTDILPSTNYWLKLYKLGLPGLIITDLLILFIQLILYQCIYKQSTYLNNDRSVNEQEVYLLRTIGESSSKIDESIDTLQAVPLVLKVKLYECFSSEAYLPEVED